MTATPFPEDRDARLVRNLLALRLVLSLEQMQTGRHDARIEEIDEALAALGHDMNSTVACAAEGMRRALMARRPARRRALAPSR